MSDHSMDVSGSPPAVLVIRASDGDWEWLSAGALDPFDQPAGS
jgi:hypothetical protein